MSSNQKEYGADLRAAKAAKLFHFCARNFDPDVKLSYSAAIRAKWYSYQESKDQTLQMQIHRIVKKLSPPSSSDPPVAVSAAATALLALAAPLNARKHPFTTISLHIPLAAVDGNWDCDLLNGVKFPSPMQKTQESFWFVGWRKFLQKYEFAMVGPDGDELLFEPNQLRQILNLDKTEISLDGSSLRVGGRPAVMFYDPHLSMASRSAAKSSLSCTGIFRSSAPRECIPPY
jgi:hypothetical protein